jgi:putative endonuclease
MVVVVYFYFLRCSDGSYYIGHTADLAARERTHNEGHGARFTGGARRRRTLVALETRTLRNLARRHP